MHVTGNDANAIIHELRATIAALRARLDSADADCQRLLADRDRLHDSRRRELEATIITLNRRLHRQAARYGTERAPGEN